MLYYISHASNKAGQQIRGYRMSTVITTQQVNSFKSRIYSLEKLGATKSVAKVKAEALYAIQQTEEINRQWVADQWFGRCANRSFEEVLKALV
jgi:hypothetical protein